MKTDDTFLVKIFLIFLLGLSLSIGIISCAAEEGATNPGNENISISVDSGAEVTFTSVTASYVSAGDGGIPADTTIVYSGLSTGVNIQSAGQTAGTFTCTDAGADWGSVTYVVSSSEAYVAGLPFASTSCTIIITTYGEIGSLIEGTFSATASIFDADGPTGTTATLTGSFSVIRDADF